MLHLISALDVEGLQTLTTERSSTNRDLILKALYSKKKK